MSDSLVDALRLQTHLKPYIEKMHIGTVFKSLARGLQSGKQIHPGELLARLPIGDLGGTFD